MKFRTEIEIIPMNVAIDHSNKIVAIGSCFTETVVKHMIQAKLSVLSNPSGILFNPASIASAIYDMVEAKPIREEELAFDGELWFHYGFHGSFSMPTAQEALKVMNTARITGNEALKSADRVLITFGTAWVYEHDSQIVANCHRQPASEFVRRILSIEEIVETYSKLLTGVFADKEVIFTVSPVRHLGNVFENNIVSKSVLRLAIEKLVEKHDNAHYFPSFEIMMDDLRDYRFYTEDLVHPSPMAVEYIWKKFVETLLSPEAKRLLPIIRHIVVAAAHHPRNVKSKAYIEFCRRRLEEIAELPQIDFKTEEEYFRSCIQDNV